MRHVIDEVITHLREAFLTEDNHDGEDEGDLTVDETLTEEVEEEKVETEEVEEEKPQVNEEVEALKAQLAELNRLLEEARSNKNVEVIKIDDKNRINLRLLKKL